MTNRIESESPMHEIRLRRLASADCALADTWRNAWQGLLHRALSHRGRRVNNELLQRLEDCPSARQRLANNFDFRITPNSDTPSWLGIEAGWQMIATDCIDGTYLLHLRRGHVGYVCTEGRSGCVATSLAEWLHVLTALPSWRELLAHSGHGDAVQMHRLAPRLEQRDQHELTGLNADRVYLQRALELNPSRLPDAGPYGDPIGRLQRAVARLPAPRVRGRHHAGASLFGILTAEDPL